MNNKTKRFKPVYIIYAFQWIFAAIGVFLAFGTIISGGFLNFIASIIVFYSALIIAPIFEMIKPLKKYSMVSLIPRAIISFMLIVCAALISPDSDSTSNTETVSQIVTETTSASEAVGKLTTTETKAKETTTTEIKTTSTTKTTTETTSTTQTTTTLCTTTITTTTVPVTTEPLTEPLTEPPTEAPTEHPTPAPTEAPYIPPIEAAEYSYVLNTNSMKFHYPMCSSAEKISPENREEVYATRDDVISWGYDPCGKCNP